MQRIAVLASGGGSNLEALCAALDERPDAAVVLVVSDRPGAGALERARRRGIATTVVDPVDPPALETALSAATIDWIVLAGYLRRVPPQVVSRWRGRIVNIHPALLPRFGGPGMYGLRVHQAVLDAGERESGATVHVVDDEYDHGPVLAQRTVPVEPDDTPESLASRVLTLEHRLLPAVVIAAVEGRVHVEDGEARIEGGLDV